jgi:hypothetical protein
MRRNGNKQRASGNRGSVRGAAFDDLVDVDTRVQRALATGTHAIERYAGTFILPSDTVSAVIMTNCMPHHQLVNGCLHVAFN